MNNFNNNFNNNKSSQLYPDEAYSAPQPKQEEGQTNPILPLLLSAMQNNGEKDNNSLLSSLLSGMSGDSQGQLIQTLTSSLNKKKKEETKPLSGEEKPFPKNDYLY